MSSRLTVKNLLNSRIPAALGICPSQSTSDRVRFLQWLNEAEERMLLQGRWWGSIQEVQLCARDCILTWPREVASIEQISINKAQVNIHNSWYAFTNTVASLQGGMSCSGGMPLLGWGSGSCTPLQMTMLDRQAVSFEVTQEKGSTLRLYPTSSSDEGKTVLLQGYDSNGIWVRTSWNGTIIDGERVTLNLPYVDTITTWSQGSPLGIQKDPTNFRVLLYEHSLLTLQDRALGDYQPGETNPFYRVSQVPALASKCNNGCSTPTPCGLSTLRALVLLNHVELVSDEDWLLFRNVPAYKEAMLAIRDWENGDIASGNAHFYGTTAPRQSKMSNKTILTQTGAIPILRAELRTFSSDRTTTELHYENTDRLRWDLVGYR